MWLVDFHREKERDMAFASVISLKNTIERLVNSSHFSLVPPSTEMIEAAYNELEVLQEHLKLLDSSSNRMCRKAMNALDAQIREALNCFETLLESNLSDHIEEKQPYPLKSSLDLQHLRQDIELFLETVKKMGEDYINELHNLLPEEADHHDSSTSASKMEMVGLSDEFSRIRDLFTRPMIREFIVFTLIGMAGIGKTTLARKIFHDPLILSQFKCRAWVRVGRKYRLNKIMSSIIAQVNPDMDYKEQCVCMEDDDHEKKVRYVYQILKEKRPYLIVLDDVWEGEVWDYLLSCFPDCDDGRILLTTRLQQVRRHVNYPSQRVMRFLNKEESWDLLREKMFEGRKLCPPRLENAGRKIAENCEGLPLLIVEVARLLSKEEQTVEYWNKVAASKQNSIFINAYEGILDVLYPSYDYLPQHLKPCFLYMGVFAQDCEIYRSKLINMWIAEGILERSTAETSEDYAAMCLNKLVSNSLVIVCQETIFHLREVKTCRLHSVLWYLCKIEAAKNNFFHVCGNGFEASLKGQRRVCFHNNILLGIKDVYDTIEGDCASTARSLLCLGPYHQYPVPICFGLRFLRVLNALTIRLFEFPMEVVKLVQLRYLALTFHGDLHSSVSRLINLQFLIIHRHLSFSSHVSTLHVPVEIWDMQELKHIQIRGSNLPRSNHRALLKNLQTLLDVNADSFTKGVRRKISNVKKLRIQVQLVPDDDDSKPFRCLNRVSRLHKLESLTCILVNPELMSEVVAPPAPLSLFPSSLKKLQLSGLGYPWEYMDILGSLPNLELLKLLHYAFQGPKWEVKSEFRKLRYLLIEDTDLVEWKIESGSFSRLRHLCIRHCYNLEKFSWDYDYYFKEVQVVDSNPLAATFLNRIKDGIGRRFLDVSVHSSWEDGKKLKS